MRMALFIATLLLTLMVLSSLLATGAPLRLMATTTIVADVVRAVAGEDALLTTLLPLDADPHVYQPTPRDVVALTQADVIFLSGAGLEAGFADLLMNAKEQVHLSGRLALRSSSHDGDNQADEHDDSRHEDEPHDEEHSHDLGEVDPHVWFDPTNVTIWTSVVEETLVRLDPESEDLYRVHAATYRRELAELDLWIWEQILSIPADARRLVTDHLAFGYFASRYGFEQVGSLFPGTTTLSDPSARELAKLIDTIEDLDVPALFVGTTVSSALAETVAEDTGTQLIYLYTGSLSSATGPAPTYIEMMRHNVRAIVEALAP